MRVTNLSAFLCMITSFLPKTILEVLGGKVQKDPQTAKMPWRSFWKVGADVKSFHLTDRTTDGGEGQQEWTTDKAQSLLHL